MANRLKPVGSSSPNGPRHVSRGRRRIHPAAGLAGPGRHRLKPTPAMANWLKPVGSSSANGPRHVCRGRRRIHPAELGSRSGPHRLKPTPCYGKPAHAGSVAATERASARFPWQTPDSSGELGFAGLAGHRLKPMPAMANRLTPVGSPSRTCLGTFAVADAGFNRRGWPRRAGHRLKPQPATGNRLKPVRLISACRC